MPVPDAVFVFIKISYKIFQTIVPGWLEFNFKLEYSANLKPTEVTV